jgi:transcriptional regulator with XRE-family HTH domain
MSEVKQEADLSDLIARNAKGLRKRLGLTLQETADRSGLAKSYVWELENGRNTNPSITTLIGLCGALGCSLDALVGREVYMKPQLRPEAMRIAVEVDTLLRAALSKAEGRQ